MKNFEESKTKQIFDVSNSTDSTTIVDIVYTGWSAGIDGKYWTNDVYPFAHQSIQNLEQIVRTEFQQLIEERDDAREIMRGSYGVTLLALLKKLMI